ncbi:ABC transporter permease subunit [Brevibacillus sp. GCM10020057]|uniref:ABC transporter permease subunit n=1 Tax=Brevibacillus sp. GCM10020057 TaxID=3317327 RepID=UPI0036285C87
MNSHTFWALVRHEFTCKGNRRKLSRSQSTIQWRAIYLTILALFGAGTAVYYAVHGQLPLQKLWLVAIGFPYILLALAVAMLKREWDNETHGWWLTLPYSRMALVGAKFVAAWLRVAAVCAGAFVLILLFAGMIALLLAPYTSADVLSTLLTGLNVILIVIGYGPLILSFGLMLATMSYTTLRPFTPLLWIGVMICLSMFYNGIHVLFPQSFPGQLHLLFPYSWAVWAGMGISWIAAYLLIRFSAWMLDRKLTI